jgi:branched-subunit amino acid aminotransferase/4-amino-4-deoxychorismate lyase
MLVFLNGRFMREEEAVVSVFDRSFLYGDGLFETMLIANGKPFRWTQHWERLQRGADFLKIKLPFSVGQSLEFARELIARNKMPDALLRLTLSRGIGARGYSPKGAEIPATVMSLHEIPKGGCFGKYEGTLSRPSDTLSPVRSGGEGRGEGATINDQETGAAKVNQESTQTTEQDIFPRWKLITSSLRLPANEPLAQFKTCNKLPQILARAEADAAGADEALLSNTDGFVVEGATSNLFWIERDSVCTPPLASGVLAGVTRAVVLEICKSVGLKTRENNVTPDQLKQMNGVFVSLSSWGIMEAESLDGFMLGKSLLTENIRTAYWDFVRAETM